MLTSMSQQPVLSRRAFSGVSGAGLAAGTFSSAFGEQTFSVGRSARILKVLIDQAVRWAIDPADFGPNARASFSRHEERIHFELSNARFAGTIFLAHFGCTGTRSGTDEQAFFDGAGVLVTSPDIVCVSRLAEISPVALCGRRKDDRARSRCSLSKVGRSWPHAADDRTQPGQEGHKVTSSLKFTQLVTRQSRLECSDAVPSCCEMRSSSWRLRRGRVTATVDPFFTRCKSRVLFRTTPESPFQSRDGRRRREEETWGQGSLSKC